MAVGQPQRQELTSWKEIAEHLGVSVRAAQKWEQERGLPIQRLPGEKGRVSADPLALDRWKKAALEKPSLWASLKFLRYYAAAATAVVLAALTVILGGRLIWNRHGPPARFRHDSKTLTIMDEAGRELWQKTFEDPIAPEASPEIWLATRRAWFGDLDGDGRVEFLYVYKEPLPVRERTSDALICFSDTGKEKWRFAPGKTVSTATETFPPTYAVHYFVVAPLGKDRSQKVLVASHHVAFYPEQFAVLSSNGGMLGEYWHSGHLLDIELADLDGDRSEEVLLGGISNAYKAATLVVLDPLNLGGASQEENPAYQFQGFGPGKEKARILFPRSCISRKFDPYNLVSRVAMLGERIKITVFERYPSTVPVVPAVFYFLDKSLRLVGFEVADLFRSYHRELESSGQLDHSLTDAEIAQFRNLRVLKPLR